MSSRARPHHHLRHHPARRRAGARILDGRAGEADHGARARRPGRRHHRGRVSRSRRPPTPRRCGRSRARCGGRSSRRSPAAARRTSRRRRRGARSRPRASASTRFIATSDLHLTRKLRMTREQCLEAAVDAVRLARRLTDDVEFSAEDATRSDRDFLCRVVEAVIDAGCTHHQPARHGRLRARPTRLREFFADIRARVPNADRVVFSTHCHDDLGLAVANSLAAIQGGVRQVECTINGIGERAGNASLEEIVMALRVRHGSPAVRHRDRSAGALRRQPAAHAASPTSRSRPTRPSSAATRSRTKPASTRTAC